MNKDLHVEFLLFLSDLNGNGIPSTNLFHRAFSFTEFDIYQLMHFYTIML